MTTIRSQERLDAVITAAGKWYDPVNKCISRRMKDPQKLIEYADKIARLYFIPNVLDGRGAYVGRYEYRENLWGKSEGGEGYYAVIEDEYQNKESIVPGAGTIMKYGNFWYYELPGIYAHKDKPMLFH